LHIACRNTAPLEVVQFLVEQWPEAVKIADGRGWLPFHVACINRAPLQVVQFLVEHWSEAVKIVGQYGWLPLHLACINRAPLQVIQFLVEQWPESIKAADTHEKNPLDCAEIPEVIAWLQGITFTIPSKQLSVPTTSKPEPEPKSFHSQGKHNIASKLVMLDCSDYLVFLFLQIAHMRCFSLWFSLWNRTTANCMQ
jgi:hypothetical protein